MDRIASLPLFVLIASLIVSGCGKNNQRAAEHRDSNTPPTASQQAATSSAADVVAQFLDEIRRGGEDSHAQQLLTQRAQTELKRIGRTVEPIGSPDARFQVTRAEAVPDEPNSALVHCVWIEPNGDGTTNEFQVVWAVERESGTWRISGLVMELDQAQPPMIIDFEDGEMMARLFSDPDFQTSDDPAGDRNLSPSPSGNPSQAAVADPNLSR